MKMYVEHIIIHNRAPFDHVALHFRDNEIAVLTAVNGKGKTTILSYIVDAWHEMARPHFNNEFEGKEYKLYRVSGSIYNIDQSKPSFVYIRFKLEDSIIDYVDIRNTCTQEQYDEVITLENKIPFSGIQKKLEKNNYIKHVSDFDKKKAQSTFDQNIITYFPSYRYEIPGYLNDPYKINLDFTTQIPFSGYLPNPLEVVTELPQLANWIMDVVLDMTLYRQPIVLHNRQIIYTNTDENILWSKLNTILTQTLASKAQDGLRFGIGKRNSGGTRIAIMKVDTDTQLYPTIFNLSSGEAALLCMFGEILRQADKIKTNISLDKIQGIVLIDEVDKHLHIKLQKEILPTLFNLFPHVQFIVSSHSPFLNMGLAETSKERARVIDLDNHGIFVDPVSNDLYKEVYDMMINENNRFVEKYNTLLEAVKQNTKPLIITEGKTDVIHLKKAKEVLGEDCDIEFYEIEENWGESELKKLLENVSKIKQNRKIIGIFDRDVKETVNDIEKDGQSFKNFFNNVYAFCIPVPAEREGYVNISIEFYYTDSELQKEKNGKRLYFDNEVEFLQSASNTQDRELRKLANPKKKDEHTKKIFDKNIGELSWIHSKATFANLVATDEEFAKDFNFDNFSLIFNKIKEIINIT
jgi:predicted ATP-binding protein involved in virulence